MQYLFLSLLLVFGASCKRNDNNVAQTLDDLSEFHLDVKPTPLQNITAGVKKGHLGQITAIDTDSFGMLMFVGDQRGALSAWKVPYKWPEQEDKFSGHFINFEKTSGRKIVIDQITAFNFGRVFGDIRLVLNVTEDERKKTLLIDYNRDRGFYNLRGFFGFAQNIDPEEYKFYSDRIVLIPQDQAKRSRFPEHYSHVDRERKYAVWNFTPPTLVGSSTRSNWKMTLKNGGPVISDQKGAGEVPVPLPQVTGKVFWATTNLADRAFFASESGEVYIISMTPKMPAQ